MGEESPGVGLGVNWEGNLIYDHIYQADTRNTRFIPILYKSGKAEHIPAPLRGSSHHRVDTPRGYEDLYRRLTNQPYVTKPELGRLRELPRREPKQDFFDTKESGPDRMSTARLPSTSPLLFGREKELAALDAAWDDLHTNVVSLVAFGGVGKTALVNVWLNQMGRDDYRGTRRVYGWSFYSQGAAEGRQVSADLFIASALRWFGDANPDQGSPWDKGERLAELVAAQRTLLILDGLEPLQYPPGEIEGRLKDPGLQSLLRGLARRNPGLCVVSTRLAVDDLKEFAGASMEHVDLEDLSPQAGAQLLESLGVKGTPGELKQATRELEGHALALTLLGTYLDTVYEGDVRRRDKIPELIGMKTEQGRQARLMMAAYEGWFKGKPELPILHIMGLFDRPVEQGALRAVLAEPAIDGLTSILVSPFDEDKSFALSNLRDARLLAEAESDAPDALDCHPLVREHFGERLKEGSPAAWTEAHSRLYEYYKALPEKDLPDTIEEMAPLYAAVAHGCHAGRHPEALNEVYVRRIQRGTEAFSTKKLGAVGAGIAALSGFFDSPWSDPVAGLTEGEKGYVLNQAGFGLRALGRLAEAVSPFQEGLKAWNSQEDWRNASRNATNLSELYSTSGDITHALAYGQQSVELADRSGDAFERMAFRTTQADALHQAGRLAEAEALFGEAEEMQKERQPQYPLLYSVQGYQYCDLLLGEGKYGEVQDRVGTSLDIARQNNWLLDIAMNHLSLGRAYLLEAQQEGNNGFAQAAEHLYRAVDGLREAGTQHHLPRGLLARAELRRERGDFERAQRDLEEAMSVAERGGMDLHQADAQLG